MKFLLFLIIIPNFQLILYKKKMIPRYNRPKIEKIWSDQNKFKIWTEIECLIAEQLSNLGLIPKKAATEIRTKAKRDGEIAQKVNLGNANSTKIVQSLGQLYDEDWIDITRGYDKDITLFKNQQTEAYANQVKVYNSLKPPTDPSRTGLMLEVATAANGGYQRSQTKKEAKQ